MAVTNDNPKREKLRISISPEMLLVACSMGKVTKRSMSVAPNDGAIVMTCT